MMSLYLSNPENVRKFLSMTYLSQDELESLVGKFPEDHPRWPNQLKGEVVFVRNKIRIRHHFTKKKIWEDFYEDNLSF